MLDEKIPICSRLSTSKWEPVIEDFCDDPNCRRRLIHGVQHGRSENRIPKYWWRIREMGIIDGGRGGGGDCWRD
jgi:hypothetical protein